MCASVCSGIGAPEVAWAALGWKFAFAAEIEKFPSAVLAHRFPEVPNYGDMTKHEKWKPEPAGIDVLVGGTPCQSFSVAGLRAGLADPRGNLTLVFLAVVAQYRPRWVVWENVPGVHSSWSDAAIRAPSEESRILLAANGLNSRDFEEVEQASDFDGFLDGLEELGYGVATRVLDAQYFDMAQRRERVFVVARAGGQWQRAAAVLSLAESLRGDPAPRRDAGQGTAASVIKGAAIGRQPENGPQRGEQLDDGSCFTLNCTEQYAVVLACNTSSQRMDPTSQTFIPFDVSQITSKTGGAESCGEQIAAMSADHGGGDSAPHVAFASEDGLYQWASGGGNDFKNTAQALRAGAEHSYQFIKGGACVRRLTPRECERLQGFPTCVTRVTISACLELQKSVVCVGVKCRKLPFNASRAGEEGKCGCVQGADINLQSDPESLGATVRVHVRSSHADKLHLLRNQEKCILCASGANQENSYLRPMRLESFAHDIAAVVRELEALTKIGKAESLQHVLHFTLPVHGNWPVVIFGQENAGDASDAEPKQTEGTKSTMSKPMQNVPRSDWTVETWLCYVLNVINGFTPIPISKEHSFSACLDLETDFTAIPWKGKPASECADGPRYKALGNSMAVPVLKWIGQRIQLVDAL